MPDDGLGVELPTVIEAESIDLAVGTETLVASAVQMASCCDVWYRVPSLWVTVVIRLYGRIGAARALLRQVTLSRAHGLVEDGELTGIAMSIRGRPVTAFELTCQSSEVAVTDGAFYLSVWQSSGDLQSSGGDEVPETSTSGPLVTATLLAHDADTGELRAITTDSSGRLIMANPTFSEGDQALLDDATDAATPSTLVKRDGSAATRFTGLFTTTVDHDTPTPGALSLGTGSGTTSVVVGKASGTTTLWNATFEGTTTVIDSTSLQVSDRVITVNRTAGPSAPVPSHIAGISVMRGDISGASRDFAGFFWDESAQAFRTAFNTSGDDSTLGSALPLIASELRGPTSAPAVIRSSSSSDAVQLSASTATLLSVSDASGTTNVDPGDRPLLIGAATSGSGAGHSVTVQAQQARGATAPGNLTLAAGKGGTPGTNVAGDIIFDNGQLVSGVSGFNRWQAAGTDYLTMQQTTAGPSFVTADGCQLIMKASGAGTTLNANTGNLNLYGNGLATLYASAVTLGGSAITWEDASINHTVAVNNVRSSWAWAFDAAVTNPSFGQTQAVTGAGTSLSIRAQQGAAGSVGGNLRMGGGVGGTSGTNKAGDTQVDLGVAAGGVSARFSLLENASEFLGLYKSAGNLNLDSSSNFYVNVTGQLVIQPVGTQIGNDLLLFNSGGWTCHLYTGNASNIIKQDDVTTNAVTAAPFTIQAQNATGTTATGGKLTLNAGTGTTKGGNLELYAGSPTGSTGSGGDLLLGGGSFTIGGEAGNIAMHKLGGAPPFGGGGKITFLNNFHTEPTSNPTTGLFFWSRNGQLTTRDQQGAVQEVSTRWTKTSSATGVFVLTRADNLAWASVSAKTVLQIPNSDLPAASNWICHALVTYLISDTSTSQSFAKEHKEITFKKIGGTVTFQSANTVGVFYDGTSAAVNAAGCTASVDGSSNLNFTVNSLKGELFNAFVRAELTFFVP